MAGATGITIVGTEQVIANLNNLDPEAKRLIKQAMQNAASAVQTTARQLAPYDTGYLRSQILIDSVTETKAQITSHAEYSIYQKDDFMGDALEQEGPKLVQQMQKVYSQAWQSAR